MTDLTTQPFLWGASTSGHQVEGDNTNSDTWFLEHCSPTAFLEPSGKACDSFNRWSEDLDLAASLGLSGYRFSVEWARIEPEPGRFDDEALAHYGRLLDGCHRRGLAPLVTYNHFTAPHWFAASGGFLDEQAPELFARYCARVTETLGERIAFAMTLNEPNLPRLLHWIPLPEPFWEAARQNLAAASTAAGVERYRSANVAVPEEFDALEDGFAAGHLAARDAIRSVRPDLPVGLGLAMCDDRVIGDDTALRDRKRAALYNRWLNLATDDDFIGVQNYAQAWYDGEGEVQPDPPLRRSDMGAAIHPTSLAGCAVYAHEVSGAPVMVTEHGVGIADDQVRAEFLPPSVEGLLQARDEGTPVLGYFHWSLLDNFEWVGGYGLKFGLVEVDHDTFERRPKPSATVYRSLVAKLR